MINNQVIETYNKWSLSYDSDPNPLIPIEELTTHSLLRSLKFQTVLDACTGTGRYAIRLAQQGKSVTAIDASDSMLAVAKRKAAEHDLTIDFRSGDISALPFDNDSFDLVICALALSHNPDLEIPCQELVRVLCPSGNLVITDLHPHFQNWYGPDYQLVIGEFGLQPYPLYHLEVDEYTRAIEKAGATVLTTLDVPSRWIPPEGEHVAVPGALIIWATK
jgi:ubiquinone/menaquinone biosynthesis C-methylase UbiE